MTAKDKQTRQAIYKDFKKHLPNKNAKLDNYHFLLKLIQHQKKVFHAVHYADNDEQRLVVLLCSELMVNRLIKNRVNDFNDNLKSMQRTKTKTNISTKTKAKSNK